MGLLDGNSGQSSKHFNGTVTYQGQTFQVVNGMCEVEGEKFFVSDDGRFVVDADHNVVAIIQDGQLVELTPELLDQLKQEGAIE